LNLRLAFLCLLAAGCLAGLAAPTAQADVKWLCRPGLESNPCQGDQTTRFFESDGSSRVARPDVPDKPPVDCFYVYPTVSNQPGLNATQAADPEIRSIAVFQAQRFSTVCRVFSPLYRQVTAAGVTLASQTHDTSGYTTAFADVREAWQEYLKRDNDGRGVVLVGHSQGSRLLRALIRREIDPNPDVRDRLVSAVIPGANATVAKGRTIGGDFSNVPSCESGGQFGCVISYSTFNDTPPSNARFGRTDTDPVGGALGLPTGPGIEVMCTDPTKLSGTGGKLESLVPSAQFAPGVIAALLLELYGGPPPSADTPWLQPSDHYTGRCTTSNGANVLMLSPVAGARKLTPSPDPTWGTHLVDLNIALGNVLTIVGAQAKAWLADHRPLSAKLRKRRVAAGARGLTAAITGPPGRRVRVTLRRRGHRLSRRSVKLDGEGRRSLRFKLHRGGSYRVSVIDLGGRSAPIRSKALRLR
jgi:hypothetical protein